MEDKNHNQTISRRVEDRVKARIDEMFRDFAAALKKKGEDQFQNRSYGKTPFASTVNQPQNSTSCSTQLDKIDFHRVAGEDDPMAALQKLKQQGSVADYMDEFNVVVSRFKLSEECQLNFFLAGLKDEGLLGVQSMVRIFQPISVQKAFSLAELYESKLANADRGNLSVKENTSSLVSPIPDGSKVAEKADQQISDCLEGFRHDVQVPHLPGTGSPALLSKRKATVNENQKYVPTPAIDPLQRGLVMSIEISSDKQGNVVEDETENVLQVVLSTSVLIEGKFESLLRHPQLHPQYALNYHALIKCKMKLLIQYPGVLKDFQES